MSGFPVKKKAPCHYKNIKKKFFQLICAGKIFKTVAEFFENKWVSIYSTLGDFVIQKKCSSQQLLINANKKSRKQQIVLEKIIKLSCKISAI